MKKLFLFIGVIMLCLLFSCKKDNTPPPPPPPIDSFLLHPPPVLDSLPIPLTIGTWWKYQRFDSSLRDIFPCPYCGSTVTFDSSIETITVIGKTQIVDTVIETKSPFRYRQDTVESYMLEVKNLTKGTLDTIHAYYNNAFFKVKPNKDNLWLFIYLPIIEGNLLAKANPLGTSDTTIVNKNISVKVLNQNFDNCIYYENKHSDLAANWVNIYTLKTYLKPSVGYVDWEYSTYYDDTRHGISNAGWYYRRLIDYHIAP